MTPLSFITVIKLAAALALGALITWFVQGVRYDTLGREFDSYRADAQQAQLDAVQAARLAEKRNTQRLQEALDGAERREAKNLADAAAARRTAGGLRKQLAIYRSSLSTGSHEACRVYAGTVAELFGNCAEEYRAVAEDALRLGNSAITLNAAWPE